MQNSQPEPGLASPRQPESGWPLAIQLNLTCRPTTPNRLPHPSDTPSTPTPRPTLSITSRTETHQNIRANRIFRQSQPSAFDRHPHRPYLPSNLAPNRPFKILSLSSRRGAHVLRPCGKAADSGRTHPVLTSAHHGLSPTLPATTASPSLHRILLHRPDGRSP